MAVNGASGVSVPGLTIFTMALLIGPNVPRLRLEVARISGSSRPAALGVVSEALPPPLPEAPPALQLPGGAAPMPVVTGSPQEILVELGEAPPQVGPVACCAPIAAELGTALACAATIRRVARSAAAVATASLVPVEDAMASSTSACLAISSRSAGLKEAASSAARRWALDAVTKPLFAAMAASTGEVDDCSVASQGPDRDPLPGTAASAAAASDTCS